jgi:hypothetical protein
MCCRFKILGMSQILMPWVRKFNAESKTELDSPEDLARTSAG